MAGMGVTRHEEHYMTALDRVRDHRHICFRWENVRFALRPLVIFETVVRPSSICR